MLKAARDLEFEEAARLRDDIQRMRDFSLGLGDQKAG
jgi:excinuclease ABC subunit B